MFLAQLFLLLGRRLVLTELKSALLQATHHHALLKFWAIVVRTLEG